MIKRKTGRPSYASLNNPDLVMRELNLAKQRSKERKGHLQMLVDEVKAEMAIERKLKK